MGGASSRGGGAGGTGRGGGRSRGGRALSERPILDRSGCGSWSRMAVQPRPRDLVSCSASPARAHWSAAWIAGCSRSISPGWNPSAGMIAAISEASRSARASVVQREPALHRGGDVTHHVLGVVMVQPAELYADAVAEPLEALRYPVGVFGDAVRERVCAGEAADFRQPVRDRVQIKLLGGRVRQVDERAAEHFEAVARVMRRGGVLAKGCHGSGGGGTVLGSGCVRRRRTPRGRLRERTRSWDRLMAFRPGPGSRRAERRARLARRGRAAQGLPRRLGVGGGLSGRGDLEQRGGDVQQLLVVAGADREQSALLAADGVAGVRQALDGGLLLGGIAVLVVGIRRWGRGSGCSHDERARA